VFVFFGGSFFFTTSGLETRQMMRADTSLIVATNYNSKLVDLKKDIEAKIADIKVQIQDIKDNPAEWRRGKREVLSMQQLNTIKEYNEQIFLMQKELSEQTKAIENESKSSVTNVKDKAKHEGHKYYKVGIGAMAGHFVLALIIVFFLVKIYNEVDPEGALKKRLSTVKTTVSDRTENVVLQTVNETSNKVLTFLQDAETNKGASNTQSNTQNTDNTQKGEGTRKSVGFMRNTESVITDTDNTQNNEKKSFPYRVNNTQLNTQIGDACNCDWCGTGFYKKRADHRFCNEKCKDSWHNWRNGSGYVEQLKKNNKRN
jgi:hypothetical protein